MALKYSHAWNLKYRFKRRYKFIEQTEIQNSKLKSYTVNSEKKMHIFLGALRSIAFPLLFSLRYPTKSTYRVRSNKRELSAIKYSTIVLLLSKTLRISGQNLHILSGEVSVFYHWGYDSIFYHFFRPIFQATFRLNEFCRF